MVALIACFKHDLLSSYKVFVANLSANTFLLFALSANTFLLFALFLVFSS